MLHISHSFPGTISFYLTYMMFMYGSDQFIYYSFSRLLTKTSDLVHSTHCTRKKGKNLTETLTIQPDS